MLYAEYITPGECRWDNVAQAAYGDPFKIKEITTANPSVPLTAIIPAGIRLLIPILEPADSVPPSTLLPPWKR